MFKIFFQTVGKGAVMIIDVKDIVGQEIVGDIDILPTVIVNITDRGRMSVAFELDTGGIGDIGPRQVDHEKSAVGVDRNVTLSSNDFFSGVIASLSAWRGRFD